MQAVGYGCFLILWICFSAVAKAQNEKVCRVDPLSDIQPKTRAVFYPKESATIVCKESYRTQTKKQQDTVTCGDNGWSFSTFCEEISCSFTPEDNVAWLGYGYSVRHKLTAPYYTCKNGFRKSSQSICEITGWEPPLCQAIKGFCQRPVLENGYLIPDKSNPSVIHYGCIPGYTPSVDGWWGELTCTHSVWSDNPKCIASDKMCNPPPHVEYATITSKYKTKYTHLSKVEFQCTELYEIEGNREVTCRHGTWSAVPKCIHYCEKPDLPNGYVESPKKTYMEGEMLEYRCYSPCEPKTNNSITCKNGQWDGQVECICPQKTCQKPPVPENGDIVSTEVEDGETVVTYQCKLHYKLKDERKVRCHEGEWEPFPVCIGPCVIETIHPKYNLRDLKEKTYVLEGKKIKMKCKHNYYINNHWVDEFEVKCEDGEITGYRSCQHYTTFY